MLQSRKEHAIPGDPSESTVLGPSEGDQSTTGGTSSSSKTTASLPTTIDDSSTLHPTTSRAEQTTSIVDSQPTPTTTVDSGTTEAPSEPSSTPTTSEAEPTTRITDSHSISTTSVNPGTTNSPPASPSSSSTSQTGQSPTTRIQPTTTTTGNPVTTEPPLESSSSPTTSKVEPTIHTTDSHSISTTTADSGTTKSTPGSTSSSSTSQTGQSPTTRIPPTTTTTGNPVTTEPPTEPSSPPTTSKVEPTIQTTDNPSISTTAADSGTTKSTSGSTSSSSTSQTGQSPTTRIPPTTTTTGNPVTTEPPTESSSPPTTSKVEPTIQTTDIHPPESPSHSTPTTTENPGPTDSPLESSSSLTTSMAGHTTDSQSTSQDQVAVTTKVPDAEQSPPQSTQLDDPRPDSTVTATPTGSTSTILQDVTDINNAADGPVPTKTSSKSAQTGAQLAVEQSVVPVSTNFAITTIVTTGMEDFTTTSIGNGTTSVITSRRPFTSTMTSLVTNAPTGSTFVTSKTSKAATVAGGVVGGIIGLLILAVMFVFLRRRRRRAENIMPYSPVETRRSPGGVLAHELPPVRTVTPLIWPQHQSHASIESIVSVHDAGRQPAGSSYSEVAANPFEPAPSTHRLVDVDSVRSSRISFPSNPFEDNANMFTAIYQEQGSLGTADMASGSRREGENSVVTASSSATVMGHAQANHNRHLSYASTDCPYPVIEPNSPARHVSMKSGLSYATIDPERAAKLQAQPQLARYSAISSTSSFGVNVGYAV